MIGPRCFLPRLTKKFSPQIGEKTERKKLMRLLNRKKMSMCTCTWAICPIPSSFFFFFFGFPRRCLLLLFIYFFFFFFFLCLTRHDFFFYLIFFFNKLGNFFWSLFCFNWPSFFNKGI